MLVFWKQVPRDKSNPKPLNLIWGHFSILTPPSPSATKPAAYLPFKLFLFLSIWMYHQVLWSFFLICFLFTSFIQCLHGPTTLLLRRAWQPTSSILAWRISWTQEPGGLQSMGSQRVRHYWSDLTCTHTHTHTLSRINHPSDSSPIYCYPHTDLFSLPWIYRNNLNEKQLILLEKLSVRLHAAPLGSCVWS